MGFTYRMKCHLKPILTKIQTKGENLYKKEVTKLLQLIYLFE